MRNRILETLIGFLALAALVPGQAEPLSVGVVNMRSPALTAAYWNPILQHVSMKSGVPLKLKLTTTGAEHAALLSRGEFDILVSYQALLNSDPALGYRVFARNAEAATTGQIVVMADSPAKTLADLQGQAVAFPGAGAFVPYQLPIDVLLRSGIQVKPMFAGSGEGAIGQLKAGRAAAAGVNSEVMRSFAKRENLAYRVLWSSGVFPSHPISARPGLPSEKVDAIRDALLTMASDPQGAAVLAKIALIVGQSPPLGFVAARDADYVALRRFYMHARVQVEAPK